MSADDEALPERVAGYRVISELGRGTFSRVYRVEREGGTGFSKELAVKVLAPGVAATDDMNQMLIDEARVTSQLHHRNVAAVHEFGLHDGRYYLILDWIEGLDLRRLLRRLRARGLWLPVSAGVEIAIQVLDGLQHAHERVDDEGLPLGIVHRDINPGNVLVSTGGNVALSDFGLARTRQGETTDSGVTRGTARFMSPEQARGTAIDGRSDLFSVGGLLYIMLAGRLPFPGRNDLEVMRAVARAQFRPVQLGRPLIPDAVARAVHRLMAPSPDSRYRTARAAATALAEANHGAGADRSPRELGLLVREALESVEEETSEFDGPGFRMDSSVPQARISGEQVRPVDDED